MIKVIKALDDSVVRDSERKAFADSFGKLEGFRSALALAAEGEITDKVGAEILNVAAEALKIAQDEYRYLAESRRKTYADYFNQKIAEDIVPVFQMREFEYADEDMFATSCKSP